MIRIKLYPALLLALVFLYSVPVSANLNKKHVSRRFFAATTWNGVSWSSGAPTATTDAIIASGVAAGVFTCANLTINSGATLTINDGVVVTVKGNINNNGSGLSGKGTLRFDKSGSTVQISGNSVAFEGVIDVLSGTTLQTNDKLVLTASSATSFGRLSGAGGTISGNVKVEKVLLNTDAGWRQVSLPVNAPVFNLQGIDLVLPSHPVASERNVYFWNTTNIGSNVAAGWTAAELADDGTKAYTIYSNNSNADSLYDVTSKISISGPPHNSDYLISLGYTYDPKGNLISSTQRGWNFIPNRFASILDVSALINDANFGTTYKAIHVYDAQIGQYVGINQSTMNAYNNTGISRSVATNDIVPFQGFWVKATSTSQTITVKNSHRITDLTTAAPVARQADKLLRLNVSDANGRGDQVIVFFDKDATAQLDGALDMFKLKSKDLSVPTLYCREGALELCANALPLVTDNRSVQLAFESHKKGETYTFSPDFSAFDPFISVTVEDKLTGEMHNLAQGNYSFVYDEKFGDNRFVLHFSRGDNQVTAGANGQPVLDIASNK